MSIIWNFRGEKITSLQRILILSSFFYLLLRLNETCSNTFIFSKFILWNHGTIIQTGIACKKILYTNLMNLAGLWSRARLAINKRQKYFSIRDHQLLETWFLLLVFTKGKKEDKNKFVTKSVRLMVMIIFR